MINYEQTLIQSPYLSHCMYFSEVNHHDDDLYQCKKVDFLLVNISTIVMNRHRSICLHQVILGHSKSMNSLLNGSNNFTSTCMIITLTHSLKQMQKRASASCFAWLGNYL